MKGYTPISRQCSEWLHEFPALKLYSLGRTCCQEPDNEVELDVFADGSYGWRHSCRFLNAKWNYAKGVVNCDNKAIVQSTSDFSGCWSEAKPATLETIEEIQVYSLPKLILSSPLALKKGAIVFTAASLLESFVLHSKETSGKTAAQKYFHVKNVRSKLFRPR